MKQRENKIFFVEGKIRPFPVLQVHLLLLALLLAAKIRSSGQVEHNLWNLGVFFCFYIFVFVAHSAAAAVVVVASASAAAAAAAIVAVVVVFVVFAVDPGVLEIPVEF